MVGLTTAWFLQVRGVDVEVYERRSVAAGASWGNAGWLAPALIEHLPDGPVYLPAQRVACTPLVGPTSSPRVFAAGGPVCGGSSWVR
jgi:hypothetical protein